MVVKTFRGLLADDGQDRIRLSTIKGKVGYKIVKFQVVNQAPGTQDIETTTQIFKSEQSSVVATVNFTDSDLLAVVIYRTGSGLNEISTTDIIFDNEIFNQDIFVTYKNVGAGTDSINYYIELEVIPLDDAGAEYTTLKDMRQT